MNWQKNWSDAISETLRFIGYGFVFLDAIILAVFSLWFVSKFIWHLGQWLNRVIFSKPW